MALPAAAAEPRPAVGLFTTLPIYWGEAEGLDALIDAEPHWARSTIERDYRLVPLDVLGGEGGNLARFDELLLAQPRVLSPAENVALDAWVRGGGHLLLFADPMLTAASRYPLGDKRRPQAVALLSPILAHWGLKLRFDERQPAGVHEVAVGGVALPVNLAGTLAGGADCAVLGEGLVARCAIGRGRAMVVADAALFDDPAGEAALRALLGEAFAP